MARPASMWWRKSHGAYYVTIGGKSRRLSADKREAQRLFHRLMLDQGKVELSRETVKTLCDLFLDDAIRRLRPLTIKSYKRNLQSFVDFAGTKVAADLKPIDVTLWLNSHDEWGQNSRTTATTIVKIWSRWCKRHGCLADDPLATVAKQAIKRRKPPPKGAIEAFMGATLNPRFRDFLELQLLLGTRPGELRTLEARKIDLDAGVAIVVGKKGERRVMLPDRARAILEPLVRQWPEGPVLRNTIGKPWSDPAINSQMNSIRRRAGLKGIVLYHTRGAFATRAIKNGVPSLVVSKLLGHADPTIVMRYYEQINEDDLKAAAEKASQGSEGGNRDQTNS